jgi:hypothetical protein
MCTAWGVFTSSGGTSAAYRCSATRTTNPGIYRVTFNPAMASANYAPKVQIVSTDPNLEDAMVTAKTSTYFDMRITNQNGTPNINRAFSVIVFGGL